MNSMGDPQSKSPDSLIWRSIVSSSEPHPREDQYIALYTASELTPVERLWMLANHELATRIAPPEWRANMRLVEHTAATHPENAWSKARDEVKTRWFSYAVVEVV